MIRGATDSKRVLPRIFNGVFEKGEERARRLLDEIVREDGGVESGEARRKGV